jgi:hypothetical protein
MLSKRYYLKKKIPMPSVPCVEIVSFSVCLKIQKYIDENI